MKRSLLVLLLAGLVFAPAAFGKGPHAFLTTPRENVAPGLPWEVTVELNEFRHPPVPAMIGRRGGRTVGAEVEKTPASMPGAAGFRLTMVFPREGRWKLVMFAGKRRFVFPAVHVGGAGMPQNYVAFPIGSAAARAGAGGVWTTDEAPAWPRSRAADRGERVVHRRVHLGHRGEVDDAEHPSHEPAIGKHDAQPQLALGGLLGQLEQQTHADAVDVGRLRQVDHQAEVLVADRSEQALAELAGLDDVHLAGECHDTHGVVVVNVRLGAAVHAASSTPIRRVSSTVVPSPVRTTSTSSVSPSISSNPRPRCVPRGARQLPKSLISTLTVSSSHAVACSSTTPGARP